MTDYALLPTLAIAFLATAWSSLVVGDEQLDRSNSQACMERCHACVLYNFGWFDANTKAYHLTRYSL